MGGLLRQFEDSLQLVFKHYPLDSVCNSAIRKEIHPGACESARASEAARDQGKFWAFYDVLFMPRYERTLSLKLVTEELGLDFERFESYRQGEAAAAKIQDDIDLGRRLGVDGTPAVFINGRRVYDSRPEALQFLISYELERHSQAAAQ
jgi:protein-disulfide isomerase